LAKVKEKAKKERTRQCFNSYVTPSINWKPQLRKYFIYGAY